MSLRRNRRIVCCLCLGLWVLAFPCYQWFLAFGESSYGNVFVSATGNKVQDVWISLTAHLTFDDVPVTEKSFDNNLVRTDSVKRRARTKPDYSFNSMKSVYVQLDKVKEDVSFSPFKRTYGSLNTERERKAPKPTNRLEVFRNDRTPVSIEGDSSTFRSISSLLFVNTTSKKAHLHVNRTAIHKSSREHGLFDERSSVMAALNVDNDMDLDSFAVAEGQFKMKSSQHLDIPAQNPVLLNDVTPIANDLIDVVSMSLYGSDKRYTTGALRNAELVKEHFRGWQLWVYMDSSDLSRYGTVPSNVVSRLVELGAYIHYVTPQEDFIPPMMWRFLVADDPAVDRFIVRDVDSRLTRRDAAAVAAWIRSKMPFHCVRDHPSHAGFALSGGLWGGRAPHLRRILRRSWATMMRGLPDGYLNDMNFLNNVIWPRIQKHVYCSDSVSCDRWMGAAPFPVTRRGSEHVGQVYDENDFARRIDTQMLQQSGENSQCIPH